MKLHYSKRISVEFEKKWQIWAKNISKFILFDFYSRECLPQIVIKQELKEEEEDADEYYIPDEEYKVVNEDINLLKGNNKFNFGF